MKAVKRFNPTLACAVSFACIGSARNARIHSAQLAHCQSGTTSPAQTVLQPAQRQKTSRLAEREEVAAVARPRRQTGSRLEMESRLSGQDVTSIRAPMTMTSRVAGAGRLPTGFAHGPGVMLESSDWQATGSTPARCLGALDERSRDILAQRWLTMTSLRYRPADRYQSRGTHPQLENNAMRN